MSHEEATPLDRLEDYQALVGRLTGAARAYYGGGESDLTDADYDAGLDTLRTTEAAHPEWADSGGLLTEVAAGVAWGDVRHSSPMLSLDKTNGGVAGVRDWWHSLATATGGLTGGAVVEPKVDGASVAVRFRDGRLSQVILRGDGRRGLGLPTRAHIVGLPTRLDRPATVEVRGEVYMTAAQFARANDLRIADGSKRAFANPRNAVAGSLRASNGRNPVPMSFAAYSVHGLGSGLDEADYATQMKVAGGLGFATAVSLLGEPARVLHDVDEVEEAVEALRLRRRTLGFEIDGAVVKANDVTDRIKAGEGSRSPKWAVAVKFAAERASTTLLGVKLEVGRTGVVSMTADLAPVAVGGVTVTSATLHNASEIARLGLCIGDRVVVCRAGDVIPRVEAVIEAARPVEAVPWVPPTACPRCGGGLDTAQAAWRCHRGRACGLAESIRYACSRDVLDIEGAGEEFCNAVVAAGLVRSVADLYHLNAAQVAALPRMGDRSAEALVANIAASRRQPLHRVFCALGLRLTGRRMSSRIATHFGSLAAIRAATVGQMAEVEGVGPIRAASIVAELEELAEVIDDLVLQGMRTADDPQPDVARDSGGTQPLAGMKVVITGAVPGLTRTAAQEAAQRLGATVSGSVSARTDLVVVGEGAGSKQAKAEALGLRTMTAEDFAELVGLSA